MLLFKTVSELQVYLKKIRQKGNTIGFAPTMGALHRGHVSLIAQAKEACGIAIASIFVNPTQFNNPKDLEKYPRTAEKDIELLVEAGCDILFMPDVTEIYPDGLTPSVSNTPKFNFGKLDKVLEGTFRPGHFDGMVQVVYRLLDIVKPQKIFMGQKDFQQYSIVASMITQAKLPTEIVRSPTVREDDGLAMSSRNVRLTADERALAPTIFQTLKAAHEMVNEYSPAEIQREATTKLKAVPNLKMEYFDIVDGRTLLPIQLFEDTDFAVALTAVWLGDVRLIDNIILKQHVPMIDESEDEDA